MTPRPTRSPLRTAIVLTTSLLLSLGALAGVTTTSALAAETGSISGTVSPVPPIPSDTAPEDAPAVDLVLYQLEEYDDQDYWSEVGDRARTNEAGAYSFTGLPAGTYQVRMEGFTLYGETDQEGNTADDVEYAPMYWPTAPTVESGTPIVLTKGKKRTAIDFSAVEAGHITGHLAPAAGITAENLSVLALHQDPTTKQWGTAEFSPFGEEYRLSVLPGTYRLKFYDGEGLHYTQFWDGAASVADATDVTVRSGDETGSHDATLEKAGRIEGSITDGTGTPVEGAYAQVEAYDATTKEWEDVHDRDDDVEGGNTGEDPETGALTGRFGVGPLPAGTYRVKFTTFSDDYLDQYYDGKSEDDADLITLERGEVRQGVDGTLEKPGTVKGKVVLPTNKGLARAFVELYQRDGTGGWSSVSGTETSSSGSFQIGEVPAGTYALKVFPGTPTYAPQVYLGKTSLEQGTPVVVASGRSTTLSTIKLVAGGAISGSVTLPSGVTDQRARTVEVVDAASGELQSVGTANKVGSSKSYSYSIKGLAAGSYRVQFARASGQSLAVGQYFKGVTEALGKAKATSVKVSAGKTTSGINGSPTRGGSIQGRILDAEGQPVRCYVMASTDDESLTTRTAFSSAATGVFTITGLSQGAYRLTTVGGYPGGEACNLPSTDDDERRANYYYDSDEGSYGHTTADPDEADLLEVSSGTTETVRDLYYGPVDQPTIGNGPAPRLAGTPAVGKTLTSTIPGHVAEEDDPYTIQWYRGTSAIDGATNPTYKVVAADAGAPVSVRYTFSREGHLDVARGTDALKIGAYNLTKPSVSGTASVGKKLTAGRGTWAGSGWTYTYQWYRGSTAISKATKSTYTTTKSDRRKSISVRVTARKSGYPSATAASSAKKIG